MLQFSGYQKRWYSKGLLTSQRPFTQFPPPSTVVSPTTRGMARPFLTCPVWPIMSMRPFRQPEAMAIMRPLRITIVPNIIPLHRLVVAIPMVCFSCLLMGFFLTTRPVFVKPNLVYTVRPRDTRPQAARTSQVPVFELGPKIFEMNESM